MIKTLPDGTTLWVKWSNENPNTPGQHTNGPPYYWVRFSGSETWHCAIYLHRPLEVRAIINNALTKQDILDGLGIEDKIDIKK